MKNSQYKDKQELVKLNQSKQLKFRKLDTTELKSLAAGCISDPLPNPDQP